ncbi:hypothetical protein ACJX0J_027109 [Zea mays]
MRGYLHKGVSKRIFDEKLQQNYGLIALNEDLVALDLYKHIVQTHYARSPLAPLKLNVLESSTSFGPKRKKIDELPKSSFIQQMVKKKTAQYIEQAAHRRKIKRIGYIFPGTASRSFLVLYRFHKIWTNKWGNKDMKRQAYPIILEDAYREIIHPENKYYLGFIIKLALPEIQSIKRFLDGESFEDTDLCQVRRCIKPLKDYKANVKKIIGISSILHPHEECPVKIKKLNESLIYG